jgi:hypothetical protein
MKIFISGAIILPGQVLGRDSAAQRTGGQVRTHPTHATEFFVVKAAGDAIGPCTLKLVPR